MTDTTTVYIGVDDCHTVTYASRNRMSEDFPKGSNQLIQYDMLGIPRVRT